MQFPLEKIGKIQEMINGFFFLFELDEEINITCFSLLFPGKGSEYSDSFYTERFQNGDISF